MFLTLRASRAYLAATFNFSVLSYFFFQVSGAGTFVDGLVSLGIL